MTKNDLFGICIPLGYFFCTIPEKIATKSKTIERSYFIYTKIAQTLIYYCHLCEWIKIYQIITGEYFIFDELIRNWSVTSLHFQSLIKLNILRGVYKVRLSDNIINWVIIGSVGYFETIIEFERQLYNSADNRVKEIYQSTIKSIKKSRIFYVYGLLIVIVFYIAAPLFRGNFKLFTKNLH